ncbi:hypothetical protein CMK18_23855 [Candidatus Poribacteria bacterium]|nr:hypothetical protein [Candidatus Poribacteria bacterium]
MSENLNKLQKTDISFLKSLTDLEFHNLIQTIPKEQQAEILEQLKHSSVPGLAATSAAMRMRKKRQLDSEVDIREIKDVRRRNTALSCPFKFIETYFTDRFFMKHASHHEEMIKAICHVAQFGGDQAISAPRGEGKTTVATIMMIYAILKQWVRFPIIIAQTGPHAERIFKDIKYQFEANTILGEDFPEIIDPIRSLEGAPQRGNQQRHDGERTRIAWKASYITFPFVQGSPYGGISLSYFGLDSAIRGLIVNGMRPDFVLIDDPETRESAQSPHQISTRAQSIDRDIAGLAGPRKRIARVMLCTIQNRYCLAYQYTDPKQKSSWSGKRFKMLDVFPENTAIWDEYIIRRQEAQREGDKEAKAATQFYIDNREEMDRGAKVSNPQRFDQTVMPDGWKIEQSALQHCYNIISDYGIESFLSECQNDPSEESGPETSGLTAVTVAGRMSGLDQGELHPDHQVITIGIDLGKYLCHWVMIGWQPHCIGNVIDYGILEVSNVSTQTSNEATEIAIFNALVRWRSELLESNKKFDMVLIDSGDFTKTTYQFVREVGGAPFMVSKGTGGRNFVSGKQSNQRIVGENWYASYQQQENIWLYMLDTDYWKQFVHQRFLTPTFNEAKQFNSGSLSVFSTIDRKKHLSFSHHIVAEERREEFKPGKGLRVYWHQVNRNNHYLDATYMACAAARMKGIDLPIGTTQKLATETKQKQPSQPFLTPTGQTYLATQRK